jgi:hypothetical protein
MATDASPNGLSSEEGSAVEHGTAPADIVLGDPDRGLPSPKLARGG